MNKILIVEDEYFIAAECAEHAKAFGLQVYRTV